MDYKCEQCGVELRYKGVCYHCGLENNRSRVLSMSDTEINAVVEKILSDIDAEAKKYFGHYLELLCYRGFTDERVPEATFIAGHYYPSEVFYKASAPLRKAMIDMLMTTDDSSVASSLLCALAVTCNPEIHEDVLAAFIELEKNPRPWRKKLYVNPSIYAECGGWTFTPEGKTRRLVYDKSFPMIKGDKDADKAAVIGRLREDRCPRCGVHLVDLLTIDCDDTRLAHMGEKGKVTAIACINCSPFNDNTFSKYSPDGAAELYKWEGNEYSEAYLSDEDLEKTAMNTYVLAKEPVPIYYGCNDDETSVIGGMGNWIQDWEYRNCPDCGKPMKYYAQVECTTTYDMEGFFYLEICTDCKITNVFHQQT